MATIAKKELAELFADWMTGVIADRDYTDFDGFVEDNELDDDDIDFLYAVPLIVSHACEE